MNIVNDAEIPAHPTPSDQSAFVLAALRYIAEGWSEWQGIALAQLSVLEITDHWMSGPGFMSQFKVSETAPRLPYSLPGPTVSVTLLDHAEEYSSPASYKGECLVWLTKEGLIDSLEGYVWGDRWPRDRIGRCVFCEWNCPLPSSCEA